jgi:hypothetical protein
MTVFPDGVMKRESTRAEVWFIEAGAKHWVPDEPTVNDLGGWRNVDTIWPPDRIDNPLGPMRPSVIDPYRWDAGSLLIADPDDAVFVMQDGQRRWVPDPATFDHNGYDWDEIQHISTIEMNAIPRIADIPRWMPTPSVTRYEAHTGPQFLGAGHYMDTSVQLLVATGQITGTTRTSTVTWFGGFHGGAYVILSDINDYPVANGQSPLWRYGVAGRWIGRSDRTDAFTWFIDVGTASQVRNLRVFHTWAADEFQTILGEWVAAGKQVAELAQSVASVAKVVAAIAG